jgi:hypothetical protein
MARNLKPLPKNQSQILQETITPYDNTISKTTSDTVFTKNRGRELSFKNIEVKDFSVSIQDHDAAVLHYFENNIRPTVLQNGQNLPVPVIYGSPERWKSVQADGYYRDKSGKLLVPLIMIKKGTITQDRTLGNKLDGNKVHNYQLLVQKFNAKNQYDKFSVITNREPSSKVYMSSIPDYVTLTYSCIIFADYIEHMNKMIEAINFASDSYWGDPNRYKFRTVVSPFSPTTEVTTDDSRVIKTTFDLTLHGYIIPDTINRAMASNNLYYGTSQLIFNFETTTEDLKTYNATAKTISRGGSTTIFEGGNNITQTTIGASTADVTYLSTSIAKSSTSQTSNTVTFSAVFAQPERRSSLPATSKSNFVFYVNGIYIDGNYVTSFIENGNGTCTAIFNTTSLGYNLESTDEVVSIGKFI